MQPAVLVMSLLGLVAFIFNLMCLQFHFLANEGYDTFNAHIYELFLLMAMVLYFFVYSVIFFSWFCLTHSLISNHYEDLVKRARKALIIMDVAALIFTLIVYVVLLMHPVNERSQIVEYIGIIWTSILAVICIVFIIYAYCGCKQVFVAAKISEQQRFGHKDMLMAKRLLFLNSMVCDSAREDMFHFGEDIQLEALNFLMFNKVFSDSVLSKHVSLYIFS